MAAQNYVVLNMEDRYSDFIKDPVALKFALNGPTPVAMLEPEPYFEFLYINTDALAESKQHKRQEEKSKEIKKNQTPRREGLLSKKLKEEADIIDIATKAFKSAGFTDFDF